MSGVAFLDTGVVLAFCFRDDKHHKKCDEYISNLSHQPYISDRVEREYVNREPDLAERYSDGIFEHLARLQRSDYEGQLDSMDISKIRQQLIRAGNPASTTLHEFYRNELPNFILRNELLERLRELARDIEQNAIESREELLGRVNIWARKGSYPGLADTLSSIHEEDREICIDAHDLAVTKSEYTELATTNPNDFVRGGFEELIVSSTGIDVIISLADTT